MLNQQFVPIFRHPIARFFAFPKRRMAFHFDVPDVPIPGAVPTMWSPLQNNQINLKNKLNTTPFGYSLMTVSES
jgi:hypothetical protein